MRLTDFHAKYFGHELTKRSPSDSVEKLAAVLADAQVDLNPHQVEAALFAFRVSDTPGAITYGNVADDVADECLGNALEVVEYDYPRLVLDIRCGSGTYVRSLGRDLAERLGNGAERRPAA